MKPAVFLFEVSEIDELVIVLNPTMLKKIKERIDINSKIKTTPIKLFLRNKEFKIEYIRIGANVSDQIVTFPEPVKKPTKAKKPEPTRPRSAWVPVEDSNEMSV